MANIKNITLYEGIVKVIKTGGSLEGAENIKDKYPLITLYSYDKDTKIMLNPFTNHEVALMGTPAVLNEEGKVIKPRTPGYIEQLDNIIESNLETLGAMNKKEDQEYYVQVLRDRICGAQDAITSFNTQNEELNEAFKDFSKSLISELSSTYKLVKEGNAQFKDVVESKNTQSFAEQKTLSK